ncbi:MAG TPA: pseudouridine synthase, partial [Rudaea sp.]
WFAGDERPQRGNRPRPGGQGQGQNVGRGQRDGGIHQNRNPFAQNEGGAQPGNRFKPKRDNNRPRSGGNQGNVAHGQRPFRQDEALPRDDIGNRLHPDGRQGGGRRR